MLGHVLVQVGHTWQATRFEAKPISLAFLSLKWDSAFDYLKGTVRVCPFVPVQVTVSKQLSLFVNKACNQAPSSSTVASNRDTVKDCHFQRSASFLSTSQ